jgi:hypothetical protein
MLKGILRDTAYVLTRNVEREEKYKAELEELFERTEAPIIRAVEERVDWRGDQLPLAQRVAMLLQLRLQIS